MRLAVFTNEFPARVSTFFSRDMRALLEAGIDIDIFPLRPLQRERWQFVPEILNERILPRSRVHHISLGRTLPLPRLAGLSGMAGFLADALAAGRAAARVGVAPLAKTAYVALKAQAWARWWRDGYDHVLAYWGSYPGTCAYLFHRRMSRAVPFSLFLHAGADLYQNQIFLETKLRYADNVLLCSEYSRSFLRETYPQLFPALSEKVLMCHHGLDLAEFPFRPQGRRANAIVAVGGFDKFKGFDHLLSAVSILFRRGVDVRVEMVGDGPEAPRLHRIVRSLGIADRVTFHGWLPNAQTRAVMNQAVVLAHPSAGTGDGIPNVIIEAMALGTAVVASDWAGIPEALQGGEYGLLVPPGNALALAEALQRLLADSELRNKYAATARRHVERNFDLWKNGQRLAQRLLATRRAPNVAQAI